MQQAPGAGVYGHGHKSIPLHAGGDYHLQSALALALALPILVPHVVVCLDNPLHLSDAIFQLLAA
jgi:hypothetical protein